MYPNMGEQEEIRCWVLYRHILAWDNIMSLILLPNFEVSYCCLSGGVTQGWKSGRNTWKIHGKAHCKQDLCLCKAWVAAHMISSHPDDLPDENSQQTIHLKVVAHFLIFHLSFKKNDLLLFLTLFLWCVCVCAFVCVRLCAPMCTIVNRSQKSGSGLIRGREPPTRLLGWSLWSSRRVAGALDV